MNNIHLEQIIANYIKRFDIINNDENEEYYKWEIAARFRRMMDDALQAPDEDFPDKIMEVKILTENLIDSYTTPFYGLKKFSEKEPAKIREMFKNLFAQAAGDIKDKQKAITDFLKQSHDLRDLYYPESFLYKDDFHSVTGYLFLYDPEHNYIYKASNARHFADCIEFYDDWGSGDTVKLNVYYRMCDQIADAAKNNDALMKTNDSRFLIKRKDKTVPMHPDREKHILTFDLIYCCLAYDLFDGIKYDKPNIKERNLLKERKEKAQALLERLENSRAELKKLNEAERYINSVYVPGVEISHRMFKKGVIESNDGERITVGFENFGEKILGTITSVANGIIVVDSDEYMVRVRDYQSLLKREKAIKNAVIYAERDFSEYADYID